MFSRGLHVGGCLQFLFVGLVCNDAHCVCYPAGAAVAYVYVDETTQPLL